MNDEKKIAQAIMDAMKMKEESYCKDSERCTMSIEDCLLQTCRTQGLSTNLWYVLTLSIHWWNDLRDWAEEILSGKDTCSCGTPDDPDELCPVHKDINDVVPIDVEQKAAAVHEDEYSPDE